MKRNRTFGVAIIVLIALLFCAAILAVHAYAVSWTPRQTRAHEIAESARDMGLPEDDPILVRASEIWWEDANAKVYLPGDTMTEMEDAK